MAVAWDDSGVLDLGARKVWVPEAWWARTVVGASEVSMLVDAKARGCPPLTTYRFCSLAVMVCEPILRAGSFIESAPTTE